MTAPPPNGVRFGGGGVVGWILMRIYKTHSVRELEEDILNGI